MCTPGRSWSTWTSLLPFCCCNANGWSFINIWLTCHCHTALIYHSLKSDLNYFGIFCAASTEGSILLLPTPLSLSLSHLQYSTAHNGAAPENSPSWPGNKIEPSAWGSGTENMNLKRCRNNPDSAGCCMEGEITLSMREYIPQLMRSTAPLCHFHSAVSQKRITDLQEIQVICSSCYP